MEMSENLKRCFPKLQQKQVQNIKSYCYQCLIWIFFMSFPYRESDANDEDEPNGRASKRQVKLTSIGFTGVKRKSEDIESNGKGRCKFFQARKLELLSQF